MADTVNVQTVRAQTIRARIMVGNALCAIAESEYSSGLVDQATASLLIAQRTLEDATILLSNPGHVSNSSAQELGELIQHLHDRAQRIEALFRSPPAD